MASDSRWLHFVVQAAAGSLEGSYRDVQGRLYRIDSETAKIERLGASSMAPSTSLPFCRMAANSRSVLRNRNAGLSSGGQ